MRYEFFIYSLIKAFFDTFKMIQNKAENGLLSFGLKVKKISRILANFSHFRKVPEILRLMEM